MANNNNYVIQTEKLTKRFGGLAAVNRVPMKFKEGEIMGLIGPNGTGKKTLKDAVTALLEKRLAEYTQPDIDSNIQKEVCRIDKQTQSRMIDAKEVIRTNVVGLELG